MPKRTDIKSILIIGAGPIVIGMKDMNNAAKLQDLSLKFHACAVAVA